MTATRPVVVFGTPRKLPKAAKLDGRVVVLDIAFAAGEGGGASFDKVTRPFIEGLGARLAAWVDHHDHVRHRAYEDDARFVLATKAQHGACPEMVTEELVRSTGPVDTIVCHNDFDGLFSAAKWLRGGIEPYPGADDDARCVDTRIGTPSELGQMLDRALRSSFDETLRQRVVRYLEGGVRDDALKAEFEEAAGAFERKLEVTRALADAHYAVYGQTAICDLAGVTIPEPGFDRTELLLMGQARAQVALLTDHQNVTLATGFDSGINFLKLLGVTGGMPTVVSISRSQLDRALKALRQEGLYTGP